MYETFQESCMKKLGELSSSSSSTSAPGSSVVATPKVSTAKPLNTVNSTERAGNIMPLTRGQYKVPNKINPVGSTTGGNLGTTGSTGNNNGSGRVALSMTREGLGGKSRVSARSMNVTI